MISHISAIQSMPVIQKVLKDTASRIEKISGVKVTVHIRLAYMPAPEDNKEVLKQIIVHEYDTPWHKIISQSHKQNLTEARFVYMYFSKIYLKQTLRQTGFDLGGRHYTTIINGLGKIDDLIFINDPVVKIINSVKEQLPNEYQIK